jgi:hypothetical protein
MTPPMPKANLIALAARCEAADGSEQRELLISAWEAIHGPTMVAISPKHVRAADGWTRFQRMLQVEAYESAAMTLVPEGVGKELLTVRVERSFSGRSDALLLDSLTGAEAYSDAATPALALTAASLRALAKEEKE